MTEYNLCSGIEVYEVGTRRLYAKTSEKSFAIFEDELTPEELMAIARDIEARRMEMTPEDGKSAAGQGPPIASFVTEGR
jgi:hypothetical protein